MNGCFTVISWTSPRLSTSFCFAFSRALLQFFSLRESVLVSWFPTKKKKKKKGTDLYQHFNLFQNLKCIDSYHFSLIH